MGGQVIATRGGMIHLVLQQCRNFEDAFNKAIDGGKGGASLPGTPAYPKHPLAMLLVADWVTCRSPQATRVASSAALQRPATRGGRCSDSVSGP
jgi:hypothetical protein